MEVLSLGYISDLMRGKKQPTGEATAEELQSHHCYTTDLMSDGFVSPMVLPNDRLRELKGDMSVEEMAKTQGTSIAKGLKLKKAETKKFLKEG